MNDITLKHTVIQRSMQRAIIYIILFIVGLVSCKTDKTNEESTSSTFVIRLRKQPEQINPILFPSPIAREVYQYLFLAPAEINPEDLSLTPIMIEKVEPLAVQSNGAYTLDVKMLKEAKWTDGKPVTGEDYVFTLKSMLHPNTDASAYKFMSTIVSDVVVDAKNSQNFQIVFDDYAMEMKENALGFELLPKHIYDPQGLTDRFSLRDLSDSSKLKKLEEDSLFLQFAEDFNSVKYTREVVSGSGPYTFEEWKDNETIVLKRKENYWGREFDIPSLKANMEKIIFAIIPDEIAAITQLAAGNVDFISGITAKTYNSFSDSLKDKTPMNWLEVQVPKYYALVLNTEGEILKDKKIRQALQAVNNTDQYITIFEGNKATKMTSFVPPFMPGFNSAIKYKGADPESAKKLLDAAGWIDTNSDGVRDKMVDGKKRDLVLQVLSSAELSHNQALIFKEDCAKVGINIDVKQMDFATIRKEHLHSGSFDIIPSAASLEVILENPYDAFYSKNSGASNVSRYKSAVADSLIQIIITTEDDSKRIAVHKELQAVIYEDVPSIFLYAPQERIAISKKWHGSTVLVRPGYKANTFTLQESVN